MSSDRPTRRDRAVGLRIPLIVLYGAILSFGCGSPGDTPATSTLDRVLATRVLRVGMNPGYAPFEMVDRTGAVVGFDVDVASFLADQLGEDVRVEIVKSDWDPIIANLNANKFDVILSGMTRTPQRALRCAFTDPYFTTGQALLVNRSRQRERVGLAAGDFDRPDVVIATKLGTTGEIAARKFFRRATIKTMETETDAALEVESGRADVMVYDQPYIAIRAAETRDRCFALLEPFTREHLAMAVRRGDLELKAWLDIAIAELKESGLWDELYRKWFVTMEWRDGAATPSPAP